MTQEPTTEDLRDYRDQRRAACVQACEGVEPQDLMPGAMLQALRDRDYWREWVKALKEQVDAQAPQQPAPVTAPESEPVAPDVKAWFCDFIDARTAQGVETYGTPLMTHNGRSATRDAVEELVDALQYLIQERRELLDRLAAKDG